MLIWSNWIKEFLWTQNHTDVLIRYLPVILNYYFIRDWIYNGWLPSYGLSPVWSIICSLRKLECKKALLQWVDIFVSTWNPYLAFKHQKRAILCERHVAIQFFIFSPIESHCKIHCSSECIYICFLHCEISNWTSRKDLLCGKHLKLLYLYVFSLVRIINVFWLLHEKKPCYNKCIYIVFPQHVPPYEQDYFSLIHWFQCFLHSMILHMMEIIDINR